MEGEQAEFLNLNVQVVNLIILMVVITVMMIGSLVGEQDEFLNLDVIRMIRLNIWSLSWFDGGHHSYDEGDSYDVGDGGDDDGASGRRACRVLEPELLSSHALNLT